MIAAFSAGVYVGVGVSAGIAFYLMDDPWKDEQPRPLRAAQSIVVAVLWLPFLVFALGPLIVKDAYRYLRAGIDS